jgi:SAM-dependent methyltransferase
MSRLADALRRSWLSPRYIGTVYMQRGMERARPWAHGVLLDVGCGLRLYESIFVGSVSRYIGLDWPSSAEGARQDVSGDALHLPFADQSVDTVLATELMEHLPDPVRFLAEVDRVLRPGGTLILSVPFLEPIHEEPRDFFRFTPFGLRALLERQGFRVERLWQRGGWWSVVVGSFMSQVIYERANPILRNGRRQYSPLKTALALPVCTALQLIAYGLDKIVYSRRYTLGFIVVATR